MKYSILSTKQYLMNHQRSVRSIVPALVLLCLWLMTTVGHAQENENDLADLTQTTSAIDSLKAVNDSIVQELRNQVQELKLQGIMMREQLELSGKSAKEDSLRLAERKARIDSLRNVTQGAPLIVEDDTLLVIYARKGGMLPEVRAAAARAKILETGKRLTMFAAPVYVFDSEESTDVMVGESVILSVTDLDALWNNTERVKLAEQYRDVISQKIQQLHDTYGMQQKLMGILYVVLIIIVLVVCIAGLRWLFRRWKFRVTRKLLRSIKSVSIKNYALLDTHRLGITIIVAFNLLRLLIVLVLILSSVPFLFSAFPETKTFTYTIFSYVWGPLKDIFAGIVNYLPNLFKIAVIIACFHYLLKLIRYFANEVASGRLKINGFYADWAMPTHTILRVLLYSFMLVMIWPLLPNSDSEIFQGVSVFIAAIVSLGSTSVVGNIMAGLVMTYMRPFHVGDVIRFGDTEGEVIEKSMLVTRIRTRKNELVTIPNSNIMSSDTSNFTSSARRFGIIVHTKVTIGYDEPWKKIEALLLQAAEKTDGIKKHPKPFVRITALDDFYVEYEINGYTDRAKALAAVYSSLHQNMLDTMHGAGVEIMSPHIEAKRENLPLQIPPKV